MARGLLHRSCCRHFRLRTNIGCHAGELPPPAAASLLLQETQTKPEGQIHFFPIIMDGGQLYKVMSERCGPSQGSGPK